VGGDLEQTFGDASVELWPGRLQHGKHGSRNMQRQRLCNRCLWLYCSQRVCMPYASS
jgi:hypothetical protein